MIVAIFVCFISGLIIWWYKRPRGFPKGPRGLPLVGVIPFIGRRPEIKFQEWAKHYGPILSVRMTTQDWVVLNSYDVIMEAMVHKGRKFISRPKNYILDVVLNSQGRGVAFSSGKVWETHRRLGNSSFRSLGVGKQRFEGFIQDEVSIFLKNISDKSDIAFNCRPEFGKSLSNIICRFLFGKRFDTPHKISDFATDDFSSDPKKGMLFNTAVLMPFLRFFPPISNVLSYVSTSRVEMSNCFKIEIDEHKLSLDKNDPRDYIDTFLLEQMREGDENGENVYFSDDQLLVSMIDMFGAGIDTTNATLLWCIQGLFHFPQFQEKIQDEIDKVIGAKLPCFEHRREMHFTQAYIQEIHRFCTVAPLGIPHCAVESAKIGGFSIPKDTQVFTNLWACHNDPKNFKNPREFCPQRFLDSKGSFINSLYVIPFMVGPRHCLGEPLAKMEVFLFLVMILQKYSVRPDSTKKLLSMNDGVVGIVHCPRYFETLFNPRGSSSDLL